MPKNDKCRTCVRKNYCNRSDRARGMPCKDYKKGEANETTKYERRDVFTKVRRAI